MRRLIEIDRLPTERGGYILIRRINSRRRQILDLREYDANGRPSRNGVKIRANAAEWVGRALMAHFRKGEQR